MVNNDGDPMDVDDAVFERVTAPDTSSDEDVPLTELAKASKRAKPTPEDSSSDDVPLSELAKSSKRAKKEASPGSSSDDSWDMPLSKMAPKRGTGRGRGRGRGQIQTPNQGQARTRARATSGDGGGGGGGNPPRQKRTNTQENNEEGTKRKWNTLVHSGVLFPPDYVPHGVKMLYDGKPVDLTPEQEEVATFFAVMKETPYMAKPMFVDNFFGDFREVLGKKHVIQKFEKCDFEPIYQWHLGEKEKKAALTKEEKKQIKEEKDEKEAKYRTAQVDDRIEDVGNFRVEPPGLFRGRGEHPKMGKVKKRIYPEDITLNLGEKCPIPTHPYPGRKWKNIVHKHEVTWLAYWRDPVNSKEFKYVWLSATSAFKSDSDVAKYEKARKLKDHIQSIRRDYESKWESKDMKDRQMGTALYFIDVLALRAGHEKDEDEADTVGCCTLKVANVQLLDNDQLEFDFLGKDSIQYQNTVKVNPKVYKNVELFKKQSKDGKARRFPAADEEQLFDAFDAQDLNKELKSLMDGLSAKVFRTYNASITLHRLLLESTISEGASDDVKKAAYDAANKQVAILCNHQRAVPKGHEGQMEKLSDKIKTVTDELKELQTATKDLEQGNDVTKLDRHLSKVSKKEAQLSKLQHQAKTKEDLKTVALGTSKINYLDPRITVAWCKRNEFPIQKVFQKTLLSKFRWAMSVEPEFEF
ncbi:hypothetical protein BSKO_01528 [Bryopsis sp. KO-2023]|nr:hypothetical protein BSKO_01528 [Bryopsis sp. KO-2023]